MALVLPAAPPRSSADRIVEKDQGWGVYALQTFLNRLGKAIEVDGVYGPETRYAVETWQKVNNLMVDGIVGPATQKKLIKAVANKVTMSTVGLPIGLLVGILEAESGFKLDEVNWMVSGGVDCGATQRRVYGPPYNFDALKAAFGPKSLDRAATELRDRKAAFLDEPWVNRNSERAARLAAFAHNWPHAGGADYYAQHGHVQNPDGACTWLPRDRDGKLYVKFPNGVLVKTRQDWAEFLAMGGRHGESRYCRYVTVWT